MPQRSRSELTQRLEPLAPSKPSWGDAERLSARCPQQEALQPLSRVAEFLFGLPAQGLFSAVASCRLEIPLRPRALLSAARCLYICLYEALKY